MVDSFSQKGRHGAPMVKQAWGPACLKSGPAFSACADQP